MLTLFYDCDKNDANQHLRRYSAHTMPRPRQRTSRARTREQARPGIVFDSMPTSDEFITRAIEEVVSGGGSRDQFTPEIIDAMRAGFERCAADPNAYATARREFDERVRDIYTRSRSENTRESTATTRESAENTREHDENTRSRPENTNSRVVTRVSTWKSRIPRAVPAMVASLTEHWCGFLDMRLRGHTRVFAIMSDVIIHTDACGDICDEVMRTLAMKTDDDRAMPLSRSREFTSKLGCACIDNVYKPRVQAASPYAVFVREYMVSVSIASGTIAFSTGTGTSRICGSIAANIGTATIEAKSREDLYGLDCSLIACSAAYAIVIVFTDVIGAAIVACPGSADASHVLVGWNEFGALFRDGDKLVIWQPSRSRVATTQLDVALPRASRDCTVSPRGRHRVCGRDVRLVCGFDDFCGVIIADTSAMTFIGFTLPIERCMLMPFDEQAEVADMVAWQDRTTAIAGGFVESTPLTSSYGLLNGPARSFTGAPHTGASAPNVPQFMVSYIGGTPDTRRWNVYTTTGAEVRVDGFERLNEFSIVVPFRNMFICARDVSGINSRPCTQVYAYMLTIRHG